MSRLPLRSILPDFLTSVARVLLGTLRDGLKKSTNLVSKFGAIFGDVLASLSARHLSDGAPTACTYTVSGSFSLPSPGFFSPFPHGTGSLSVNQEYLALEDGPPFFKQDSSCPALLLASLVPHPSFRIRGCHPLSLAFPDNSPKTYAITRWLLRFRSPLLAESRLISFPRGT